METDDPVNEGTSLSTKAELVHGQTNYQQANNTKHKDIRDLYVKTDSPSVPSQTYETLNFSKQKTFFDIFQKTKIDDTASTSELIPSSTRSRSRSNPAKDQFLRQSTMANAQLSEPLTKVMIKCCIDIHKPTNTIL